MNWKSQGEDLLMMLLWGTEKLMFPTMRNLFESLDAWEHRHRLDSRVRRLEQRQLLKRERRAGEIVWRLTARGRLAALGGRDPEAHWRRAWDGQWRMMIFDLPVSRQKTRVALLRWLRANGFGYLQNSVWIHPDPVAELTEALKDFREDVESLTLMEAHCCAGYFDAAIVRGAWDLPEINRRYAAYLPVATTEFRRLSGRRPRDGALGHWLRRERLAWEHAVSIDPLLPRVLLPSDYQGQRAWQARQSAFSALATRLAG